MRILLAVALSLFMQVAYADFIVRPRAPDTRFIIYEKASETSKILSLEKSVALGQAWDSEWIKVTFLGEDKKFVEGWIRTNKATLPLEAFSSKYQLRKPRGTLRPLPPAYVETEEPCTLLAASPRVKAVAEDFRCEKNIIGKGYSGCTTEIQYTVGMSCGYQEPLTVRCDTTIETINESNWPSSQSDSERKKIHPYGSMTYSGRMEVHSSIYGIISPVWKVRLTDYSCLVL